VAGDSQTEPTPERATQELAGGKLLLDRPAQGVLRLTISNPGKRNALDHPILDAITDTLARAGGAADGESPPASDGLAAARAQARATEVRCLIITGAHGMFSAGYDIGEIPEGEFEQRAERLVAHPFTEAIDSLEAFPFPTLAVLPGHTIGGGLEMALACDLRVAKEGILLGMPPAKLGLVYSHTGLRRFIDAIGVPRTRELFLLGRNIDARTALAWGLANREAGEEELERISLELAAELAANAPLAQVGNKRVIAALLGAQGELDEATEQELIELRRASFASLDMREGVQAFAERRAPRWRGE
jgi:enoyl-CoA hydratase/carnithine racemase